MFLYCIICVIISTMIITISIIINITALIIITAVIMLISHLFDQFFFLRL